MAILYGVGDLELTTTNLSENFLLPIPAIEFELAGESEKKTARRYEKGEIVIAGSRRTAATYTVTFGIEAINWLQMQVAYGELAQTNASVALPEIKYAVVPKSAPYEIADADITSADVLCTDLSLQPLTKAAASPPAAGEFFPDTVGNKLEFNAAQAGAGVAYKLNKTYTNIESIFAGSSADILDSFSFSGIAYGDELGGGAKIVIPSISPANIPSLSAQDVSKFELTYDLQTPLGKRKPFELYKLPTS